MFLCGTKNGSSMALLEEPFEAPFLKSVFHYLVFSVEKYTTVQKFGDFL